MRWTSISSLKLCSTTSLRSSSMSHSSLVLVLLLDVSLVLMLLLEVMLVLVLVILDLVVCVACSKSLAWSSYSNITWSTTVIINLVVAPST